MKKIDLLLLFLILLLLVALFFYVRPNSISCLSNPIIYGINKEAVNLNSNLMCYCNTVGKPNSPIFYSTNISLIHK